MGVCRVILLAMLMACLVAGVPLPSENPASAQQDPVEAREDPDLTVHRLDADEAIPAAEIAADIAAQSEIFSGDNVAAVDRNVPTSVRQFGVTVPELKLSHFQRFDDEGRYSFGYAYPEQVRMESRSEDGVVTGSYFYTDPTGVHNQVQYLADGDGFRVAANNLPVFYPGEQPKDTPEVEEAKRKHLEIWAAIAKQNNKAQIAKEEAIRRVEAATTVEDNREAVITDALEADEVESAMELFHPNSASKIEQDSALEKQPSIKPLDPDVTIDEEKQAVITEQDEDINAGIFDSDAEPIRLLAQVYAKHVQANAEPSPQVIERPAGFHPQNLLLPVRFDLFSRDEGTDGRDAVEVTNPEFIDLRAFFTSRTRNQMPQIVLRAEEKMVKPSKFDDNITEDLLTSVEPNPAELDFDGEFVAPNELYNYYFNIANGGDEQTSPLVAIPLNRETLEKLPESLQLALNGMGAIDGHHNAQSMPSQQVRLNQQLLNQQRFASNFYNYQQPYYSPYSSFYSPYYHYRQTAAQYNPYSNYHMSPYRRMPSVRPYSPNPYHYNPYYSY